MNLPDVSEVEWGRFVARHERDSKAEAEVLERAEQLLLQAGEAELTFAERERLLRSALAPTPILQPRRRLLRFGWAAAAAGVLVVLGVRLWPEENRARDQLSLRDAMTLVAAPDRSLEARQMVVVKLFNLTRDAIRALEGAAESDGTPAAVAAQEGLRYLREVFDGNIASLDLTGDVLDAADADLPELSAIALQRGDRSATRFEAVQVIVAVASQLIEAIDAATAPDLAVEVQVLQGGIDQWLPPR